MSFSENLRDILDFRDIQTKELAAKTGISRNTIDNYLSGQKSLPNIENGVKIAKTLGVTAEYLVTRENPLPISEIPEILRNQTFSDSTSSDLKELIHDLKRLKKSDFDSIRNIIKSLAMR